MDASITFGNNYAVSGSSGSYSTTSGTMTAVTNLSATVKTSGRPVVALLTSHGGSDSFLRLDQTGTTTPSGSLKIKNGGTVIYYTDFEFSDTISVSAQGTGSISAQGINTGNSAANSGITAGANSGIAIARTVSKLVIPPSAIQAIDQTAIGSAGTYTYTVEVSVSGTFSVQNVALVVYEI